MKYSTYLIVFVTSVFCLSACDSPSPAPPEVVSNPFDPDRFLANVSELSSDEFEGRAPMSPGEQLTLDFLQDRFREAGLEPLFEDSYLQSVPLISLTVNPQTASMAYSWDEGEETLEYANDYVSWTQRIEPRTQVTDSEIVFVGYGVVAPEYGWNDYRKAQQRGRVNALSQHQGNKHQGNQRRKKDQITDSRYRARQAEGQGPQCESHPHFKKAHVNGSHYSLPSGQYQAGKPGTG